MFRFFISGPLGGNTLCVWGRSAELWSAVGVAGPPVGQPGERLPGCGLPACGGEVCAAPGPPPH